MARCLPDYSFVRGDKPLASWLVELVCDDRPARIAAGEVLQVMWYGLPDVATDLTEIDWGPNPDIAGQGRRFAASARAVVESPGFPKADFVRRLCLFRIALHEDWLRRVEQMTHHDDRHEAFQDRLIRRMMTAGDDAEREQAARRFGKLFCAALARDNRISQEAESMAASGLASHIVFDALDTALLADRPGLLALLDNEHLRYQALEALARIGPPAVDFASGLIEQLDRQSKDHGFDGAKALGAIGRDDERVIDALLRRLKGGSTPVRIGAATALEHAAPDLAGRTEEAIELLLDASHSADLMYAAIPALASVGRGSDAALRRVLDCASPRPPRRRQYEHSPDYQYDEVMWERGVAIEALHYFARRAELVLPALVEAFDSFEEYDPDWSYHGEHGRVCSTLEAFGSTAAPIVPRLVRYLQDWLARPEDEREWPKDVFGLLEAIGPAATAAVPVLWRLRDDLADGDEAGPLDPDDPLDRVLLTFEGRPKRG